MIFSRRKLKGNKMNHKITVTQETEIEVENILDKFMAAYSSELVALLISTAVKRRINCTGLTQAIVKELSKIK
jgi:ferritin-like protein